MIITDYLDKTAVTHPDKTAFTDETTTRTFGQLRQEACHIAAALAERSLFKKPIAIFMDKGAACISAFFGVAYSGNFYTVIDVEMPDARIDKILSYFQQAAILTTDRYFERVKNLSVK